MSNMEAGVPPPPRPGRRGIALCAGAILVAGLAIAAALLVLALHRPEPFRPAGAIGSMQTVTLTGGQVFFGRLTSVRDGAIVLTEVYEAVSSEDPKTQQRTTRLVSRRLANWHGPLDMSIPYDRVLFMESIGPESSVGKAMQSAATH